jgi:hypothetical protein
MSRTAIRYAGDFYIEEIQLLTIKGGSVDLKDIISSIDIFEDIGTHAITGTISFMDTNNLIYNSPIIGQERLYLKIYTPQKTPTEDTVIDFTKNTLYINKIINVTDYNDQTKIVTLSFTTQDIYMNSRVRVSKSYTGEPSDIVKKILRSPTLLNSKKKLFFEKTTNNYKFVIPNMRPFSAINMIAQKSLSSVHNLSPTYLFFETCFGYHFRSIDSMFDRTTVSAIYREHNPTILDENGSKNFQADMETLRELSIVNAQDSFLNTRMGMYSSNIIIYDWYSKNITKKEYNYLDNFSKDKHTQQNAAEGSPNPLVSEAKEYGNKRISDFPDSIQFLQGTILNGIQDKNYYELNGTTHANYTNPYQGNNVDKWCMRRRSRLAQLESGTMIQVEVIGRTNIQAGDLVEVEVPSSTTSTPDKFNRYLSGRYLIKQLHHSFSTKSGDAKHVCHMTLVKDDVREAYPAVGTGPGGNAWVDAGDALNQSV